MDIKFDVKVDRVINAAAINETLIMDSLKSTYEINVTLTRLLMEMASKNNIYEFVYISTFHVYGVEEGKVSEINSVNPKNDYGLSHYLSEVIVNNLGEKLNINTINIRPTNIYGIPVDIDSFNRWTLIPFDFVRSALREGVISLKSSGMQQRNFVDVSDVVAATHLVSQAKTINVYGNDTLTVREFALLIESILKEELKKVTSVTWTSEEKPHAPLLFSSADCYRPTQNVANFIKKFIRVLI